MNYNYRESTNTKLNKRVIDNLIEIRELLNTPQGQITRFILNQINIKNDTLRYYLEPVNRPANIPPFDFTDLKLVNTLLESPIELSRLIKGQVEDRPQLENEKDNENKLSQNKLSQKKYKRIN